MTHLINNLRKISNWPFQWKISFKPDPSKQAQEVIFSRKHQRISHPSIYFNNNPIKLVSSQKHLGMILETKLNFQEHIKNILIKVNTTIGILRKLPTSWPEDHYLQYLNRLSGLTLITVLSFYLFCHLAFDDRKTFFYSSL